MTLFIEILVNIGTFVMASIPATVSFICWGDPMAASIVYAAATYSLMHE